MTKHLKPGAGGARRGSGRPRVGKFTFSVFCTDTEIAKVRKYLAILRTLK